ncbi:hypothetical protein SLS60_000033 [Paraconiothyrium brasiliense]|uniref:Uncharacterized protein n=1 Tax=Paraconiothyrium brasiliense TaxID=300254 RepID=A0ABR3S547_9PLEO
MAWPRRGPVAYRPSQAWFFATPEEMLGRRVVQDTTDWGPDPIPTPYEAFALEFSTREWATTLTSEDDSQNEKKDISGTRTTDALHGALQELKKTTDPKRADNTFIDDVDEKADGKPRQPGKKSVRNKRKKKTKSALHKVADGTVFPHAKEHVDRNQSGAQRAADASASSMTENNGEAKDQTKTTEMMRNTTTSSTKVIRPNDHRSEFGEPAHAPSTIGDYVSLFDLAKETVSNYRMQSPSHYALHIDVQLSDTGHKPKCDGSKLQLNITFQNYSRTIHWLCRQQFPKGLPTRKIVVCNKGRLSLKRLLAEHFPVSEFRRRVSGCSKLTKWQVSEASTSQETMRNFWDENGKSFDWVNLPTELKEHIIHLADFSDRFSNLASWSQISEPNSVPTNPNDPAHLLIEVYRDAPKLYPELKRYGTFSQGIRKIDISFDLVDFYRFFKVKVGGFGEQGHSFAFTYDVFEKMPQLNEIVVRLPKNRKKDWINKPRQMEVLYERIAEALAGYENVDVKNFLEEGEEKRFWGLRKDAVKALQDTEPPRPFQSTIEELQEIGRHDGGGLNLTKEEMQQARREKYAVDKLQQERKWMKELQRVLSQAAPATDKFYPIRCECAVSCRERFEFWPACSLTSIKAMRTVPHLEIPSYILKQEK